MLVAAVLTLVLLVGSTSALSQCGNTGEAYYDIDDGVVQTNANGINFPYWIFGNSPNSTCLFTRIDCAKHQVGGCVTFAGKYNFECTVMNVTNTTYIINAIHNFTYGSYYGGGTNPCGCQMPATPKGKYLNGYSITIPGRYMFSMDATYDLLPSCTVKGSYQDTPLKYGDKITQTFILDANHGGWHWFKVFGIIGLVVLILLIIGCVAFCVIRHRRRHHHHHHDHHQYQTVYH